MRKIANLVVAASTILTLLMAVGDLTSSPAMVNADAVFPRKSETGKNVYKYKSTYAPKDGEGFQEYSDTYDPAKRIRKKTHRKKVMRKVQKIKNGTIINTSKANKLNWLTE